MTKTTYRVDERDTLLAFAENIVNARAAEAVDIVAKYKDGTLGPLELLYELKTLIERA